MTYTSYNNCITINIDNSNKDELQTVNTALEQLQHMTNVIRAEQLQAFYAKRAAEAYRRQNETNKIYFH